MTTGDIHLEGKVRKRNKQNLKKSQHLNCDVSQCGCLSAKAFGHFGTAAERMVSVNTTSAPSATCLCRLPQPPPPRIPRLGIDRQCTHSLHRNDMAYCHFELCRDCGLGCFNELLLADIRRLSMVAVMFLYQITVFFTTKHNSITFGTLFYWLNANCVRARRRLGQSTKTGRRWGRCSIYRHPPNGHFGISAEMSWCRSVPVPKCP